MVFVEERLRFDFIQQHRAAEHQIKINGFKLIVLHERYLEVHFSEIHPATFKEMNQITYCKCQKNNQKSVVIKCAAHSVGFR